jgi:hypothetical protein
MAKTSAEPVASGPRILMQHFRGSTLICEFKGVSLHIGRASTQDDEDGWVVEARVRLAEDDVVISGSGPTRRQAFAAMRASWVERTGELGLATFDWDAVAAALKVVRAID